MMELIAAIHKESKRIYGAPKTHRILQSMGHKIGRKTLGKYMWEMGLRACYIKSYTVTTIAPDFDTRLKNYLMKNYNPEKPNLVWSSDITYIHTEKGFCYLTSIMDLFSRRIIAWSLSDTLQAIDL